MANKTWSQPSWGLEPHGGDREVNHAGHGVRAVMEEVKVPWEHGGGEPVLGGPSEMTSRRK